MDHWLHVIGKWNLWELVSTCFCMKSAESVLERAEVKITKCSTIATKV